MAQDIGQDFATLVASIALMPGNVTDGAISSLTAVMSLGNPTPLGIGVTVALDCQTGAVDTAILRCAWGMVNSDTLFSDKENSKRSMAIQCASGTVVERTGAIPAEGPFVKFCVENESGGAINAANSYINVWQLFGDIA